MNEEPTNQTKGVEVLKALLKTPDPVLDTENTKEDAARISETDALREASQTNIEAISSDMWTVLAGRFKVVTGRDKPHPADVFKLLRNTLAGLNHVTNNLAALIWALNDPTIKEDTKKLVNDFDMFVYGLLILLDRHQSTASDFGALTGAPKETPN